MIDLSFLCTHQSKLCRSANKGVKALEAAGLLEAEPAAVAQFLRDHEAVLDRAQVKWILLA